MFDIIFYRDKRGFSAIQEFLDDLHSRYNTSKHDRINFDKIMAFLEILEKEGVSIGHPIVRHIRGDIWELRPLDNRVLFFFWKDNKYVLLHHFMKKTNKTPPQEIRKAQNNLDDYIERHGK